MPDLGDFDLGSRSLEFGFLPDLLSGLEPSRRLSDIGKTICITCTVQLGDPLIGLIGMVSGLGFAGYTSEASFSCKYDVFL